MEAILSSNDAILPLRARQRLELNCQIVHDSIANRPGWTRTYRLALDELTAGFASVAIAGPWQDKPTVFEFYVLPEHRGRAFDLFETFLAASEARYFEVQSNDSLLTVMLHSYGRDIVSERIVFADQRTTQLTGNGAVMCPGTPVEAVYSAIEQRRGGGEWRLELDGVIVATGGVLFHYNRPYGDVHMEVMEGYRRRGFGAYLVQELKRVCYEFGAIPAARCHTANHASRRTLMKAGFVPYAHILDATVIVP